MVVSDTDMTIVRFCAIECELQASGERSVWWMLQGWRYAQLRVSLGFECPAEDDVVELGRLIEPTVNADGYRKVDVRVGWNVKPSWELVPELVAGLVPKFGKIPHEQAFYEFEMVHPFRDGNGRVGSCLYNWLTGMLDGPQWPPDFFDDPRRKPGEGSP